MKRGGWEMGLWGCNVCCHMEFAALFLKPPPRPLVRERTYDVLKPRRRPPGAEASSLQFQNVDAEDNTPVKSADSNIKRIVAITKQADYEGSFGYDHSRGFNLKFIYSPFQM